MAGFHLLMNILSRAITVSVLASTHAENQQRTSLIESPQRRGNCTSEQLQHPLDAYKWPGLTQKRVVLARKQAVAIACSDSMAGERLVKNGARRMSVKSNIIITILGKESPAKKPISNGNRGVRFHGLFASPIQHPQHPHPTSLQPPTHRSRFPVLPLPSNPSRQLPCHWAPHFIYLLGPNP